MKNLFRNFLFLIVLLVGATQAEALTCKRVHINGTKSIEALAPKSILGDINLATKPVSEETAVKINRIAKSVGVSVSVSKGMSFKEAIDLVFAELDPLAQKKKIVLAQQFVAKMKRSVTKTMSRRDKNSVEVALALAYLRVEEIPQSAYREVGQTVMEYSKMDYVHFNEYPAWIKSYIHGKAPYKNLPAQGQGILGITDIRQIAAHNLWPVEMKGHDILHVHYTLAHPTTGTLYFTAARSTNHLRYALIGGLFEGVDKLQFGWEQKITSHYRAQGKTLEEAMVDLATKSQEELEIFVKKVVENSFQVLDLLKSYKDMDWTVEYSPGMPALGVTGVGFRNEINQMHQDFTDFAANPANKRYSRYHREAQEKAPARSDHSIHTP